ncbi:hypothetical protein AAL_02481 [Moelleriella libera RCEF 2490]|uniref:Hydrophobin n=1 Tax=Moelleriella libera RCEF 2490 TaxID=1081109 RepID=A0A166PTF9_9HYPO|nr:hypothetical protein AAL_02481 [Moelleriella libera RCEF 2490]
MRALYLSASNQGSLPWLFSSSPLPPPPPPPPPSNKINNINGNNAQSISCGNGAQPYCCSASSTDGDNNSQYKCVYLKGSCDAIAVCCNNNNNGQTNSAKQYCSAFGNAKVIFV